MVFNRHYDDKHHPNSSHFRILANMVLYIFLSFRKSFREGRQSRVLIARHEDLNSILAQFGNFHVAEHAPYFTSEAFSKVLAEGIPTHSRARVYKKVHIC